ncbi:MAG TPA: hypothetical protein VGO63_02020 [Candidatus Paceibacterota bacterium]|jgi:hypothetical protein|nr:hypothetical protein [Candidatus Paceibacterota bacterium]
MTGPKIVTHLKYSELSNTFEKAGTLFPISSLKTVEDFESQIKYLLQEMNPIELIQFSSFLNMICQTRDPDMTMVRGVSLLEESGVIPKGTGFSKKIVFHRDNLLNLIGQILTKKTEGIEQLTGPGNLSNQKKYSEAILLNNDMFSLEVGNSPLFSRAIFLRDHFIKEWPHYYLPEIARLIYGHRITRYRYCYETLLPKLGEIDKKTMENGINSFEQKTGVSLLAYMKVLNSLYLWFFETPLNYEKTPPLPGQPKLGFDFMNINSFYINTNLFKEDPSFIKTVDILSRDIGTLKLASEEESKRSRDPITGYNKNVRIFFDNPILKISDGYYCVIDLKFLIENVCGGLLWRVKSEGNLQDFKSAYGRLMEEYFKFLINNIFKEAKIIFGNTQGADAIVEYEDKIFIIEFTTEYYRMSALYNPSPEEFIDDAYRILFNTGKEDPKARDKKDKGKLIKLNEYIEQNKKKGKTIIPVLVTENLLGNPDLFNQFGSFYNKEVYKKKLTHIQENQPLFICLDDLETFWSLFDPKDAVEGFAGFVKDWVITDKGPIFHNVSSGMCKYVEKLEGKQATINNHDFADFFSNKNLFK